MAEAFRSDDPGADLLFVGSRHGPEGRLVERAGLPFVGLPSRPLARGLSLTSAAALFTLALAAARALAILGRERADIVIGTGGYTSAAVMLAQVLRRGVSVIHEQNAVPGRTNLLLSRFVTAVCVTYDESRDYFKTKNVVTTGLPIRREILMGRDKAEARAKLGLKPDLFTVFVYGGSQGARRINDLTMGAARILGNRGIQILHQTGERNYDEVRAAAPRDADYYRITAYLEDPAVAYWAADMIVCRSGASTLAELTAVGLPAILLPYPYAYANHQEKNARLLEKRGAAVLMDEASSGPGELANQIAALKTDPERLRRMAAASRGLARPNAAANVVRVANSLVRGGSRA